MDSTMYTVKNIDFKISSMNDGKSEKDYYIHFNTKNECEQFLVKYTGRKGMFCCDGKGCHLPGVSSWKEIHSLKKKFIQ
jgi:hypothetical protein